MTRLRGAAITTASGTRAIRDAGRRILPLLLALSCGACAPQGHEGPEGADRLNVLFIVIDTLRWDHVGCYGAKRDTTPAIDGLAAAGIRFERAYSTAPWTIPSVASMITGLYPSGHTATSFDRQLPDAVRTLAEMLQDEGYRTAAVVSHKAIGTRLNFQQGYEVLLESEARGHDHISTPGVTLQALAQLERMAAEDRPFYLFVHYFDPHYNYKRHPEIGYAPPAAGRLDGTEQMRDLRRMTPDMAAEEVRFLEALYDEEIRFTDEGIGRLLARVEELGLGEKTLVVLTADHGEGFLDHGLLGHTSTLYEELVRVPLILRPPGDAARVVDRPVSLVSLTPTVLDLLGLEVSTVFHAASLRPLIARTAEAEPVEILTEVDFIPVRETRQVGAVHKKAVIAERLKLIRDDAGGDVELYDLLEDPGETEDLAGRDPDDTTRLEAGLERQIALAAADAPPPQLRSIDEAEIERLKSLGYVGED